MHAKREQAQRSEEDQQVLRASMNKLHVPAPYTVASIEGADAEATMIVADR